MDPTQLTYVQDMLKKKLAEATQVRDAAKVRCRAPPSARPR